MIDLPLTGEKVEVAGSTRINAGIYVLDRDVPSHWGQVGMFSLERDIFPGVALVGGLYGYPVDAEVVDIGTPERYVDAQRKL